MTEMALVSSRKSKLELQSKKGSKKAQNALKILLSPDRFLSTIQIGITVIGILTGIYSGASIQKDLMDFLINAGVSVSLSSFLATTVIVLIVTYLTLVLGELVPKRIGMNNPEAIAKNMSSFMRFLGYVAYPFIWILSVSTQAVVKLLGIKEKDNSITEEEIKAIISEGTEQGEIEEAEQEMIERVLLLSDRSVTSLMTHRSDIEWLHVDMDATQVHAIINETRHSVYPLYEDSIDNILGIVKTKDLYAMSDWKSLKELYSPVFFVPENNTGYQVMEKMKAKGLSTCFVVDEYGILQGMVTLKDVFEAIVGDITEVDERGDADIVEREDGSYWINAQMHFYDFLVHFDLEHLYKDDEQYDTLAGFILSRLKHIPKVGDHLENNNFTIEIVDMDGNRIDKILLKKK